MTTASYHGVVRGGTIQLQDAGPLPDGTEVVVTPADSASESRGNPAALLAALKAAPAVPCEWVDELDAMIEQGQRPPARPNLFTDEPGSA